MASRRLRTLLRFANPHRDFPKRNLDRPWPPNLSLPLVDLLTDRAKLVKRVEVSVVRVDVNLTGTDERVAVPGQTVVSSRVSTASGVRIGR